MIKISADDKLAQQVLALLHDSISSPKEMLDEGALNIRALVRTVFDTETDPWGERWAPHAPLTKQLRARAGIASVKKLFVDGSLYTSAKSVASDNSIEVTIGQEGSFAEVHQFGLTPSYVFGNQVGSIPRRSMLPLTRDGADLPNEWWDAVLEPVSRRIQELIK